MQLTSRGVFNVSTIAPLEKLETAFSDTSGVYVNHGVDEKTYFADLVNDIRSHINEPFEISAKVTQPGFPDSEIGSTVSGICVAHNAGYWLVYQPEQDTFYCFWGNNTTQLQAPGIFGSPLYCWSA
jgi:hypothetical protein